MDISVFISDLLFGHDCVIVPGFGGFICNYRPAQIHPILHTVSPPSKAISFNINLQSNDGLLYDYIGRLNNVSFDQAQDMVGQWVSSANAILKANNELTVERIGKFHLDVEGGLQFMPDESMNYLRSSIGLKAITAAPILRGKEVMREERYGDKPETPVIKLPSVNRKSVLRIAAMIVLIAAIGALIGMMQSGVEVKALRLDESGIFNTLTRIFKTEEPDLKAIPVDAHKTETKTPAPVANETAQPAKEPVKQPEVKAVTPEVKKEVFKPAPVTTNTSNAPHGYYIIIGAFGEEKNLESAKLHLLKKHAESEILVEHGKKISRIGYYVGNNKEGAEAALTSAKAEQSSAWLLEK